jgi:hypothetical protein
MTAADVEHLVAYELQHLRECPERGTIFDRERTG